MAQSVESMYNQVNDPSGLVWVAHSGTDTVPHAVFAGRQANGEEVYVARAKLRDLVVGTFVPGSGGSFSYHKAHGYTYTCQPLKFQVLTNPNEVQIKWALGEGTSIHPNAVKGGITVDKICYIGRTKHEGNHLVGYLYYSDNNADRHLVFGHAGTEHNTDQYEILLAKPKPACQCEMHYRLPLNCS